ncbi:MAG: AAA family ATPase [Ornithinimicrobium sp.]
MKIHRLRLRHVKGVQDVTVELPDSGLVVIEGPNEVGKSTLLEALDRLLDPKLKATSRAAAVTSLQPVGVDVGPFVEAEISIGGVRVVYAKQWLRQPSTVLTVLEPAREVLTGDEAANRMTQILERSLDRPLLEALRCAQSGSMHGIELADSDALTRALDAASGAELHTDDGADLVSAAQQEYERYFTATGRATGELRSAIVAVNVATDAAAETERAWAEAEHLITRRLEAAAHVAVAEADVPRAEAGWLAASEACRHLEVEQDRRSTAQRHVATVTAELGRAEADRRARAGLVDHAAERATTAQHAQESLVAATAALDEQVRVEQEVETRHARAVGRRDGVERDSVAADEAVRAGREQAETADLAQRLDRAQALTEAISVAAARLDQERATPAALRALQSLEHDLAVASAGADAAATTLTIDALAGEPTVTFNGDTLSLERPGASIEHRVAHGAELVVGDVRLRIDPHPDAVRYAQQRDALRSQVEEGLRAIGCSGLAQASERAAAYEQVSEEAEQLRRQLSTTLDGLSLAELTEVVDERAGLHDIPGGRIDLDAVTAHATECAQRVRKTRAAAEKAQLELAEQTRHRVAAERTYALAQARRDSSEAELSRVRGVLISDRSAADDGALAQRVADTRQALVLARTQLTEADAALTAVGAVSLESKLTEAQALRSQTRDRVESARAEFYDVKGRLEATAAEGRQEARERAQQQLDDARRRYDSVERRARAARHLHTTLQRHRSQAHDWYAAPYARAIERLGAAVYGDSFEVTVDSRLVITHRQLHGIRVPFEQLSGGAAEQLGILARLAVASLIDPGHCAPVVIDDALGFTDPERMKGIGRVFSGAGQEHAGQIIVLTCTPQRYDGIAGAHRVPLSA